ncbi:dynamin family protein [Ammoniphilus sp. 3BR4]|uniref:dynamin family protein n=1 Tax=Ammoniphilus sp. 3BR4 TaxID=3158265 RepID=UPI003467A5CE
MSVESLLERLEEGQVQLGKETLKRRLEELRESFLAKSDQGNAAKIGELLEKWNTGEFVLAFCGHFSAGKSTMVNTLMGKEILPSSPIPTSANVVKVKSGEAKAVAYFKNKPPVTFDYVQELDKLKELCKDGDEVVTVEIHHPNDFLINGATLLDTPGIDSTDAAHKVATESAMHLADVVVYMMDYNHVQSEINFQFTKTLKEKGKTLYLVINQIDKHFDLELDFSAFRRSVEDSFKQWGVEPDGIFYTTLKVPDHPENQIEQLHDRLYSMFFQKDQILSESVLRSALDLANEHEEFVQKQNRQEKEKWEAIIGEANAKEIEDSYRHLKEKLDLAVAAPKQLKNALMKELQGVIDNANITPYSMRELAGKYLESCQPGFKVGFLFTAGKTQQEKEARLSAFHQEVEQQAKANLQWHVKELLHRLPKEAKLAVPEELMHRMDSLEVTITPDLLSSKVKEGAKVTGDAVLNYSKDLADEIKLKYRRLGMEFIDELVLLSEAESKREEQRLKDEGQAVLKVKDALEALRTLVNGEQSYIYQLKEKLLLEDVSGEALQVSAAESPAAASARRSWKDSRVPTLVKKEKVDTLVLEEKRENASPFKQDYKSKLVGAAATLRKAAELVEGLKGQALAARNMKQRADRLEQNLFTVALFGAFSAGKSSFANAMMGDMILPVSPNPTTATINKILPPNAQFPHGTVRVKIKSEQEMTKDVLQSLSVFRIQADSIEEAAGKVDRIDIEEILPTAKPHYSFLTAVKKGMDAMKGQYNQEILVGMDEFKELVAREEKACFVEWIELYYSCPLTDQGISLVDTPGADSINARHTGVAFDYIKNADAVLFVTYYNHAFSHADREFLQQLGRVKDTFEMDKMFFLVNAADLARSKEELLGVVDHVKDNLLTCGIRNPRLYPVSSQTALLARMFGAGKLSESAERVYRERTNSTDRLMPPDEALAFSGFEAFEQDFIRFTIEELTDVAIQSALGEMNRSRAALRSFIESAKEGEEAKKRRRSQYLDAKAQDEELVGTYSFEREKGVMEKEVEELLFYVKQRLFFRFSEWFSLSFNPAVLKEEKGRDMKSILQQCFDEMIRNIVFSLGQELRATSLRLEKTSNGLTSQIMGSLLEKLKEELDLSYQPYSLAVPEFPAEMEYESTSIRRILSQFKSPKQFFEQGGRDQMRESIENWLAEPVSTYLQGCENQLKNYYRIQFEENTESKKKQLLEQLEEHYSGLLSALDDHVDVDRLESIYENLQSLQ